MTIFRPAHETDLRPAYEVFYQNEVLDSPHPPSAGDVPSYLRHVFQTGTIYVAEHDGKVLADVLRIEVPGPHPCLAALLERGFRITYVDTFVSTSDTPLSLMSGATLHREGTCSKGRVDIYP